MQGKHSLSHAQPAIVGLMLAAGRGRRYDPSGRLNKLNERLPDGRSLLRASCEALLPWVDELRVVVGPHNVMVLDRLHDLPYERRVCEQADKGMSSSLSCGLSGPVPKLGWLIALGDMPAIARSTFSQVVEALKQGARAVRPFQGEQPGHPVGMSAKLHDDLLQLEGEQGLNTILRLPQIGLTRLEVQDPGCVMDIDLPEQLARLR